MEKQNVKEYELIREEMLKVKDCATQYMSFVIGGSGVAAVALALLSNGTVGTFAIAGSLLWMSLLLTLVLRVLFYKFSSHNRFAGYCKLLSLERFDRDFGHMCATNLEIIAWEHCIDRLRWLDADPVRWLEDHSLLKESKALPSKEVKKLKQLVEIKLRSKLPLYFRAAGRGIRYILCKLFSRKRSASWHFPEIIVMVFTIINVVLQAAAVYLMLVGAAPEAEAHESNSYTNVRYEGQVYQLGEHRIFTSASNTGSVSPSKAAHDRSHITPVDVACPDSVASTATESTPASRSLREKLGWPTLVSVAIVELWLWLFFLGDFHKLMEGSKTVHKQYLLFKPVRIAFLGELDITVSYVSEGNSVRPEA